MAKTSTFHISDLVILKGLFGSDFECASIEGSRLLSFSYIGASRGKVEIGR